MKERTSSEKPKRIDLYLLASKWKFNLIIKEKSCNSQQIIKKRTYKQPKSGWHWAFTKLYVQSPSPKEGIYNNHYIKMRGKKSLLLVFELSQVYEDFVFIIFHSHYTFWIWYPHSFGLFLTVYAKNYSTHHESKFWAYFGALKCEQSWPAKGESSLFSVMVDEHNKYTCQQFFKCVHQGKP